MVCDGVLDCPDGEDEAACDKMECPGMLKCRKDTICVHPYQVCDQQVHCPYHEDDELFCDSTTCPVECECRNFVVICKTAINLARLAVSTKVLVLKYSTITETYTNIKQWFQLERLSFYSCNFLFLSTFLQFVNLRQVKIFKLENSNINFLSATTFSGLSNVKLLSLTGTKFKIVNKGMFNSMLQAQMLYLNFTGIIVIRDEAFCNLYKLKELSLFGNEISTINANTFSCLFENVVLDLRENPLIEVNIFVALSSVYTSKQVHCCGVQYTCEVNNIIYVNAKRNAFCDRILIRSTTLHVVLVVVSLFIITSNMLTIVFNRVKILRLKDSIHLQHIAIGDMLLGFYITLLLVYDRLYSNNIIQLYKLRETDICTYIGILPIISIIVSRSELFLLTLRYLIAIKYHFASLFVKTSYFQTGSHVFVWIAGFSISLCWSRFTSSDNYLCFYSYGGTTWNVDVFYSLGLVTVIGLTLVCTIMINISIINYVNKTSDIRKNTSKKLNIALKSRLILRTCTAFISWIVISFTLLLPKIVPKTDDQIQQLSLLPLVLFPTTINLIQYTFTRKKITHFLISICCKRSRLKR